MMRTALISLSGVALLAWASVGSADDNFGKPDLRCGGYCLYMALRTLDFNVANYQAIESRLGQPTSLGYSMDQLANAARSFGAHVAGVETTLEDLPRHVGKFACIALLNKGHFVNIADVADGRVLVIDPPQSRTVLVGALRPLWGGKVLLVSHQPLEITAANSSGRGRAILIGVSLILGVLALAVLVPALARRATRKHMVALLIGPSLVSCDRVAPPSQVKIPSIAVTPTIVDLGAGLVSGNGQLRSQVTVRNLGTAPLHIISVRSSCGCTVLTPPRSILEPNQGDRISVVVDVGVKPGPRDSAITIESDDPARRSLKIPVRWQAEPRMTIQPDGLDFGKLVPGQVAQRRVVVRLLAPEATATLQLRSSGAGLSAAWDGPTGTEREFLVHVAAGSEPGEKTGSVILAGNDSDIASFVPVKWRVKSVMRSSPASLFSYDVAGGGIVEARWVVSTDEDQPFQIRSVTFEGEDVTNGFYWEQTSALRHELRAKVPAPAQAGIFRKIVRVETDLGSSPHFEIPWSMVVR